MIREALAETIRQWPFITPYRFRGVEDLVLQFGRPYDPAPTQHRRGPQACFQAAYRVAAGKSSRWIYVEGFALSEFGALRHAWLTRADTPDAAYEVAWADREGAEYLGIPLRRDYVREIYLSSKCKYYGVLDAWWIHSPLVTGETPIEDVLWKFS